MLLHSGLSAADSQTFVPNQRPRLSVAIQEVWRWVEFSQRDGLPSSDISQIVEAADGTIWANTAGGLVWYDGFEWHQPDCLAGARLDPPVRIQPLDQDRILATGDQLPVVYTRSACKPVQLSSNGNPLRITSSGRMVSGKVILLDSARNYYLWDGLSSEIGSPLLPSAQNFSNPQTLSPSQPLFTSGPRGLIRLDQSGPSVAIPVSTLPHPEQLPGLVVRAAADNTLGSGMIAVSFPEAWQGVWEWRDNQPLRRIPQSRDQTAYLLAVSRRNESILAFNAEDAWIKDGEDWTPLRPMPVALRNAKSVFFDSRDRLWVATSTGAYLLRSDRLDWSRLRFPFPNRNNHVLALLAARDGKLWLGTANGLVVVHQDGRVEPIPALLGKPIGFVTALAQDAGGAIWCSSGASFDGVFRFSNGAWKFFGPADGLGATVYHNLHADSQGNLWALATGRGLRDAIKGVYRFDGSRFTRWDTGVNLPDSRVYAMSSTPGGVLWFATVGGVSRFSRGAWRHWTTRDGLRAASVFQIQATADGGLHFVDRRNGLGTIHPDGAIHYEATSSISVGQYGWSLLTDPQSNLWVATRGGLALRRNGSWLTLAQSAGLENPQLWPLAIWRNHICTGTDGSGLFCLDLNVLRRPSPRLAFESARVDGSTAHLSWRALAYGESVSTPGNHVRYRLNGGPWSTWLSTGGDTLTGLSYGGYRIELQSRDRFGTLSEIFAPATFQIHPPLFLQPVFLVPVSLSLIAAFAAIYAFATRTYQHNKKLAEKEESFRALIEYSSVGITLWDRNRRIFYVSPAVSIILGYEPSELLGEFRDDLIHPDDRNASNNRLTGLLETPGQTQRSRLRMKHKNGEYRWIEVISRNLFDNPAVGAIVTNLRDITDSTNAELAAAEARQKAENANQAKSDFLAMISHEIRTPMNGITGMCQLLIESNLNREQQDYAETIAYSAQSLLALINDVLDLSRIEAGKLHIERAPLDLADLLREVAQLMRVRAAEKQLKLEVVYPKDAPRAFYGDALRIRQILFNLTGNAVKFTHHGEVRIEAAVSYNSGSAFNIDISVKDTGIGIAEDKLHMVFQKFTQADVSTTRRYGGSGLGLSISQSLASLMGGSIDASSKVGEGSEFRLHLQLDAAPESTLQRKHSTVEALQPLSDSLDILLVEDNKVNQKLALRLLERLGCHAMVAESGVEALDLLDKHKFDLILMDCQMPVMDGYEATRRIREREHSNRHVPIVAITANAMESDLEKCLESGMDSYLTKPIDFTKLRDALETWGIDYRGPKATSDPKVS